MALGLEARSLKSEAGWAHRLVQDVVHPLDARRREALDVGQSHLPVQLRSFPYLRPTQREPMFEEPADSIPQSGFRAYAVS